MSYLDKSIDNKAVGNRIRSIRLEKGQTMEEFGELLATSKGTVNNWEKGRNLPNKENLKAIAKIGDMTVNELLYGTIDEIVKSGIEYAFIGSDIELSSAVYANIYDSISKEITDPNKNFLSEEDIFVTAANRAVIYIVHAKKSDLAVVSHVMKTIDNLAEIFLNKSYYYAEYYGDEELIFDYNLLIFKANSDSNWTLKPKMNKTIYDATKKILLNASNELNELLSENFDFITDIFSDEANIIKELVADIVNMAFKELPSDLQKEENIKHIETYILAHAKSIFIKAFGTDQPIDILQKYEPEKGVNFEVDLDQLIAFINKEIPLEIDYIDLSGNLKRKYI